MSDGAEPLQVATGRAAAPPAAVCSHCGTTVDGAPLTWVYERDARRGPVWICDRCARTHLRSIEAKLDTEWW